MNVDVTHLFRLSQTTARQWLAVFSALCAINVTSLNCTAWHCICSVCTIVTLALPDRITPSRTAREVTYAATRHPWPISTRLQRPRRHSAGQRTTWLPNFKYKIWYV